jgi:hypothetical protein
MDRPSKRSIRPAASPSRTVTGGRIHFVAHRSAESWSADLDSG